MIIDQPRVKSPDFYKKKSYSSDVIVAARDEKPLSFVSTPAKEGWYRHDYRVQPAK